MESLLLFLETYSISIASGVSLMAVIYFFYTSRADSTLEERKMQAPVYKVLATIKYLLLAILIAYFFLTPNIVVYVNEYGTKLLAVCMIIFFSYAMKKLRYSKFLCAPVVASSWYFYLTNHVLTSIYALQLSVTEQLTYYVLILILFGIVFYSVKKVMKI